MEVPTRVGFALCGSFCTFAEIIPVIKSLRSAGYDMFPIMSETAYSTDTRFGKSSEINAQIETICEKSIIHTIAAAEPIGPKKLLDILVIAPCTGNTLAKLASGIADTPVTLAAKAHLRNNRPVVIAVSSNDALSANAKNIGILMNNRGYYFVPFRQDDPKLKPRSAVAEMSLIRETLDRALNGEQMQPMLRCPEKMEYTSFDTAQKVLGASGGFKVFTAKDQGKIKAGSMLGYGIYLASESSKSMQYVGNGFRSGSRGVLMVCKASLGKVVQTRLRGCHHNQPIMARPDTDSVFMDRPDVINPEWAVKRAEQAVPRLWIDAERVHK
jgi:dipicolinate synthase subunit B